MSRVGGGKVTLPAPKLDRGKSGQVLQGRLRAAALRNGTRINEIARHSAAIQLPSKAAVISSHPALTDSRGELGACLKTHDEALVVSTDFSAGGAAGDARGRAPRGARCAYASSIGGEARSRTCRAALVQARQDGRPRHRARARACPTFSRRLEGAGLRRAQDQGDSREAAVAIGKNAIPREVGSHAITFVRCVLSWRGGVPLLRPFCGRCLESSSTSSVYCDSNDPSTSRLVSACSVCAALIR